MRKRSPLTRLPSKSRLVRTFGWLFASIPLALVSAGCGSSPPTSPDASGSDAGSGGDAASIDAGTTPTSYVCGENLECTPVEISGEVLASVPGEPIVWNGYGDPSLEHDPATGDVWMSYSWLSSVVVDGTAYFGGVRTHVARLPAGENAFVYVGENNANPTLVGPVSGVNGYLNQEVPSIVRQPDGMWQTMWISYHRTIEGVPFQGGLNHVRSVDASPADASPEGAFLLSGSATHPSFGSDLDLNTIAGLESCSLFTEPALIEQDGVIYLGLNCMSFGAGGRQPENESFVLLRQVDMGYEVVGTLLDHDDALQFGAERIEQVDFSHSQSGDRILAIVTPIAFPPGRDNDVHLGCYVMEVASLATGEMRRNADGTLYVEAIISDPVSMPSGTGACAYEPQASTGVLIVRRLLPPANPRGVEFTLMQTGLHF